MSRYKGDNSGGKGNPPIAHQFQKNNQKGGRKKGSTSMDASLRKVFRSKVSYKENGKPVVGAATEALSKRVLQHGLAGTHRATLAVADLARKYGPQEEEGRSDVLTHLDDLSLDEQRELARLLGKALGDPSVREEPGERASLDRGSVVEELTVDGLHYRLRSSVDGRDELLGIHNRAYWSAALQRRPGCYQGCN